MKYRKNILICLFAVLFVFSGICGNTDIDLVARASNGHGMLCKSQDKKILMLSGNPEQIGTAHGELMKKDIGEMVDRIFLMAGAYAMSEDDWFFTRIGEVMSRTKPFMPERFMRECDAMSKAAGISVENGRQMNFFPEMFHCSGFAVRGKASLNGRILHARVLDYLSEIGLQNNAVLMLFMPDGNNKWISVSYAGFIGTVTAMNEKGLAIGEMGGRGKGLWDGMPMSFLLREIMEKASNVEDALKIMKDTPRTCEYDYVISDKTGNMVAVDSIGKEPLEILRAGEQNEKLPPVPEDTVFISAGKRAEALSMRLKENYGKIDEKTMIEIMKRPVAMSSNLHNAVFAPETLDVWFADATKRSPACNNPYAAVNLKKLAEFYSGNINPTAGR